MNRLRQSIRLQSIREHVRAHGAAIGICMAIAVLALASHAVVLGNGFINYDDPGYIAENPQVMAGLTAGGIKTAFTRIYDTNWIPLVWLSLMLDHDLFGLNPAGYHAVNLLLHAANAALLFIVLLRMTGEPWPSALVGALFAAHPASVESVAWAAERKDVLSTFFWLLTMYFYAGYVTCSRAGARVNYILMTAAFTLGLMSKQMLVTLPFALLLLDWWPLGRWKNSSASGLLIEKLPLIALTVLFIFVVLYAQEKSITKAASLSINQRVSNALLSYVVYMGKLAWPANLCVFYPTFRVHWEKAVSSALGLAAVTALVLYYAKRLRWLPAGWFWYLGTLVPVIGLVQVGMQARADRYLYVPRIGLFVIAAWGLCAVAEKYDAKRPAIVLAALIVMIFSVLTHIQAGRWKSDKTLYEHCLAVTEGNFVVLDNLGCYYQNEGETEKAVECYKKAIEINPYLTVSYMGMGRILRARGDIAGALAQYEQALKFDPNDGDAHNNIADIDAAAGRLGPALKHYLMAVKVKPDSSSINYYIAGILVRLGRAGEAVGYYRRALEIQPDMVEAHNNLAYVLTSIGKTVEAEAHLRRAIAIKPDFAPARFTLGVILMSRQKTAEAEAQFKKAVQNRPDFAEAHNALGVALLKLGRNDEAAIHFRRAVEVNPGFVEAAKNLASVPQASNTKNGR